MYLVPMTTGRPAVKGKRCVGFFMASSRILSKWGLAQDAGHKARNAPPEAGGEAVDKGGLSAFGGSPPRGAGAIHLRRKAPKRACLYKPRLSGFVINLSLEAFGLKPLLAVAKSGFPTFGGSPPQSVGAIHLRRKAPKRACRYKPRLSGFVINLSLEADRLRPLFR